MKQNNFREMKRIGQQVSDEECVKIITEEKRAVLSVIGDGGYPYSIPIDFYYEPEDGKVYFHCAKEGHKIDAIRSCDKVCLTTWNKGFQEDGDWSWNVTSVVAFGRASLVDDDETIDRILLRFGSKYYPTEEEVLEEIDADRANVQLVSITIEHMTGKLVNEK